MPRAGKRRVMRNCCLMEYRVSIWEEENSGDWLQNNINVLNTTIKMVKMINFMLYFYHIKIFFQTISNLFQGHLYV